MNQRREIGHSPKTCTCCDTPEPQVGLWDLTQALPQGQPARQVNSRGRGLCGTADGALGSFSDTVTTKESCACERREWLGCPRVLGVPGKKDNPVVEKDRALEQQVSMQVSVWWASGPGQVMGIVGEPMCVQRRGAVFRPAT